MILITSDKLHKLAFQCDAGVVAPALDKAAQEFGIDTNNEVRHWLSQLTVESGGFTRLEENLNYSADGLIKTWPSRFPNIDYAKSYHRQPVLIANKVYGGRMGNTEPNDGWNYRGRGYVQLTGKANYQKAGQALSIDLVAHPEQAATPNVAARIAGWYWKQHNLDAIIASGISETDKVTAITKAINGGTTGLPNRLYAYKLACTIW